MKTTIALTLLTVFMSQSSVIAHSVFGVGTFQKIDVGADGDLSLDDLYKFYDSIDNNSDGGLTMDEISTHLTDPEALQTLPGKFEVYDVLDGKKDGVISRGLAIQNLRALLDVNRDGIVSQTEFDKVMQVAHAKERR